MRGHYHIFWIALMIGVVIPLAFTLPKWAAIMQGAVAGMSATLHAIRLRGELKHAPKKGWGR